MKFGLIPTVGCVNRIAEILADKAYEKFNDFTNIDGFLL